MQGNHILFGKDIESIFLNTKKGKILIRTDEGDYSFLLDENNHDVSWREAEFNHVFIGHTVTRHIEED